MFDWILNPLGKVVAWIYGFSGNYLLTIVILAVVFKLILFPFGIKTQKNSIKQAKMRPYEMAIRKKYAGRTDKATQTKMNEEIMQLYQDNNFNPASGCLPLLIQLPIMLALYSVITTPLKYILNGFSADIINRVTEIAQGIEGVGNVRLQVNLVSVIANNPDAFSEIGKPLIDQVLNFSEGLKFLGLDLLQTPRIAWELLLLIPVLNFVTSFLSAKAIKKFSYQPAPADGAKGSNALLDWMSPLMSVYIAFIVPGLLGVYWICQNLLSILQQFLLYKLYPIPETTEEDIKAAEMQLRGKAHKQRVSKPYPYDDDDDGPKKLIDKAPLQKKKQDPRLRMSNRKLGVDPKFVRKIKASGIKPKAKRKP